MKTYQVIRTHTSPYQAQDFLEKERNLIGKIAGVEYRSLENAKSECATILITNTHTQLSSLPPELLKQTKLIVHPNSGYDHFSHEKNIWEKIPLVAGHSIRAQAVAEYTIASFFEGLMELPQHMVWNKNRKWDRPLLSETKTLVVGYGHIGKKVADTLSQLGVDVTVVDPYKEASGRSLNEVDIKTFRAVLVCCSLNETSKHMFDDDFFSKAADDLLIVNGARGKIIDESALKLFLQTHLKAQAFLDVFEQEPFGEEWHHFPGVWKTSHIAGVFKGLDQKILDFESKVIENFLLKTTHEFNAIYKWELLQNKWIEGVLI